VGDTGNYAITGPLGETIQLQLALWG